MKKVLIMVLGLPGVGKSYFARHFAQSIDAVHLNSDIIRKQIFKQPAYTREEKSQVYDGLFDAATHYLNSGRSVVVDATFSRKGHRLRYFNYADKHKLELKLIKIVANEDVVKERLKVKRPDSDADYAVYRKLKKEYDLIERPHLILDSSALDIGQMIANAKEYITSIP